MLSRFIPWLLDHCGSVVGTLRSVSFMAFTGLVVLRMMVVYLFEFRAFSSMEIACSWLVFGDRILVI